MTWTPKRIIAFVGPPVCILVCASAVLTLAFVQKSPCIAATRRNGRLVLKSGRERRYADYCYSDAIWLYSRDRLDQPGEFPYSTSWVVHAGPPHTQVHYVEYPVLTAL